MNFKLTKAVIAPAWLGCKPGGNRALFGVIEEEKEAYSHSIGAKCESEGGGGWGGTFSCAKCS